MSWPSCATAWASTSGRLVDAAKTKPYGFQAFYPGPGLGGHCIPLDPYYLELEGPGVRLPHLHDRKHRMMINDRHA